MPIKVWNPKDRPVYLKSFDGDSVFIAAKAKGIPVANKFGWQVPDFIKVSEEVAEDICPTTIVKGRVPIPARKPPRSHNPSGQPASDNTRTAKQIREFALQAKDQREADKQREALTKASSVNTKATAKA